MEKVGGKSILTLEGIGLAKREGIENIMLLRK